MELYTAPKKEYGKTRKNIFFVGGGWWLVVGACVCGECIAVGDRCDCVLSSYMLIQDQHIIGWFLLMCPFLVIELIILTRWLTTPLGHNNRC